MHNYRSGSIQRVRKLITDKRARNKERAFVIEGAVALRDAVAAGVKFSVIVAAPAKMHEAQSLGPIEVLAVDDETMNRLSEFDSPPGLIGVAEFIDVPVVKLSGSRFVVCVGVNDPGNLGTIIRTAAAAGFDGIVATKETADIYNPKVVRASSAAMFSIPMCVNNDVEEVFAHLQSINCKTFGLDGSAKQDLWSVDLSGNVALLLGNEAHGLGDVAKTCDELISIPMTGQVESLNVAVSAGVAVFEVVRQQGAVRE